MRAACLFPALVAAGLAFTPLAWAQTDSTASEIAALRRELKDLAVRNQHQIDTLQHQVRELSAELAKTRRGRATAAAAPAGPGAASSAGSCAIGTTPSSMISAARPTATRRRRAPCPVASKTRC